MTVRATPVAIDTAGLLPLGEGQWRDQATGDCVAVQFDNTPLTEPFWLEDLAAARRKLAADYARMGCLVEADPVSFGGVPAMCQLVKFPLPDRPAGFGFVATVFVAKASCTARVMYVAEEPTISGVREAVLMQQLGMPEDWVLPHPYAPEVESRLPYLRADDQAWDARFPDHPLSRARVWVREAARTVRLDPAFAALSTYRSGPAAR